MAMSGSAELEAFVDNLIKQSFLADYHPITLIRMRQDYGTVEAIIKLVDSPHIQAGLIRLKKLDLLHLSVESAVLEFPDQFTPEICEAAKRRLAQVEKIDSQQQPIWNPETGITGLEVGLRELSELNASQIPGIKAVWSHQRKQLQGSKQLQDFDQKLKREWAIETGVIENLYDIDRGVTQILIEQGFKTELLEHGSTNQPRDYVLRLLQDQKNALDGIFTFVKSERELSTAYIKELHAALLRSQDTTEARDAQGNLVEISLIKGAWKKQPNYPVRDGVTYTYCPPEHVDAEMDNLISMHAKHIKEGVPSEVQTAWLHHRFTQIHPFQDGNGRVARAIASLVLIKDGLFPLVVTRDDRNEYIDALETADNGDLKPLVDLIAKLQDKQFSKASMIADTLLMEGDVQKAIDDLNKIADRVAAENKAWEKLFDHAGVIEGNLADRLAVISSDVETILQKISDNITVSIERSNSENKGHFHSQIIENAKQYLNYSANTRAYSSWVALKMSWLRHGRLVFAIHGIGEPFSGALICAPFLEFKDMDEEKEARHTFVSIAKESFLFFHNEDQKEMLSRFGRWRENVLTVALQELGRNL